MEILNVMPHAVKQSKHEMKTWSNPTVRHLGHVTLRCKDGGQDTTPGDRVDPQLREGPSHPCTPSPEGLPHTALTPHPATSWLL